jgi:phosphoribosylanthranilate isomerase
VSGRTRIKFCGMTSARDVELAVDAGADAIGAIVSPSERRVRAAALPALLAAVPPYVTAVAVSTGETDADLAALAASGVLLQFSGFETPERCESLAGGRPYVKAFHLRPDEPPAFDAARFAAYPNALVLFDSSVAGAFGGTGTTFDWGLVAGFARTRPIVVSGGLTADNVGACVRALRPYAVDVRSGIETAGAKDPGKMRAFVRAVRAADAALETVTVPAAPNV